MVYASVLHPENFCVKKYEQKKEEGKEREQKMKQKDIKEMEKLTHNNNNNIKPF